MSIFRRNIILIANRQNYVQSGLVFHLDGINKGPNANAWTDLVGGIVFTPNGDVTFGENFVNGNLIGDKANNWLADNCTVEVVFKANNIANAINPFFRATTSNGVCGGLYHNKFVISQVNTKAYNINADDINSLNPQIISANKNLCLHNLTLNEDTTTEYYNNTTSKMSLYKTDLNADIYAIRIYNRLLTEEEMRHNQQVDIERFNLVDIKYKGRVINVTSELDYFPITVNGVRKDYPITPKVPNKVVIDVPESGEITSFQINNVGITIKQITELDMSNFDTSKVTSMSNSYYYLENVINSTFKPNIDTSNVITMSTCFSNLRRVTELKLPNWNTSKVTNMNDMFIYCLNLTTLDISNFNMSNVKSIANIFNSSTKLVNLKFGYNLKVSINFQNSPLTRESALSVINGLANVNTSQTVTFKASTYELLTEEDIALATSKGWNVVRYLDNTINIISKESSIDLEVNGTTKTYNVTPNVLSTISLGSTPNSINRLLKNSKVTYVDLRNINASNLIEMFDTFSSCSELEEVYLPEKAPKLYSLYNAFTACSKLKHITIPNWDVELTMIHQTFYDCTALESLDLSGVSLSLTANATTNAFYNCSSLTDLKFCKSCGVSVDLKYCPLSHESALSVLNSLVEVDTVKTVTFSAITYITLTPEDIEIATNKGWSVICADDVSWFNEAIVCWYEPKRQGCTNKNMAENFVLKDLSGKGNDMECIGFAWNKESGISEDGEWLVFDGVDDYCICNNEFVLDDFTLVYDRDIEAFKQQIANGWNTLTAKAVKNDNNTLFIGEQLNTSSGNASSINLSSFGKVTVIPKSSLKSGVVVFNSTEYYNLDTPTNKVTFAKGSKSDSVNEKLIIGSSTLNGILTSRTAAFSLKQYFLFNRTLTDEEITWIKNNLIH